MKLTTAELVYINEAAKALKQKDFILIDNIMIGIDNILSTFTYLNLDNTFIVNHIAGCMFNTRSLSAFIKTITLESEFEFDFGDILKTQAGGELTVPTNRRILEDACRIYKYATSIDSIFPYIREMENVELANKLYNMNKSDGEFMAHINNHIATVFPSLIPMNKSDKLFITVFDNYPMNNLFTIRYRICKKKFNVIVYVSYKDV